MNEAITNQETDTGIPCEELEHEEKKQEFKRKYIKAGYQKKSLLIINRTPSQKKNSSTFSNSFQVTDDEHLITYLPGPRQVFTVLWYNESDGVSHQIVDTFSVNFKIEDLINQVVILFNKKFDEDDYNFRFTKQKDGFDLYMAKKKNGRPNMVFPSFDKRCLLIETQLNTFALYARDDVCNNSYKSNTIIEQSSSYQILTNNRIDEEPIKEKYDSKRKEPSEGGFKQYINKLFCLCYTEQDE